MIDTVLSAFNVVFHFHLAAPLGRYYYGRLRLRVFLQLIKLWSRN